MKFAASPSYRWYVAFLLFVTAGLNYGDRTAITAVFPLLRRDLGMTDLALAATGTVFLWAYAAASPVAGMLGDRMSRARLLTASLGAWSLVMTLSALAGSAAQLLGMRLVLGLAEAAYIPAATALLSEHHGPATRARAMGLHLAGFSVGMVGGGALAGFLGDRFGWRPSFVILGAAGLGLTAVCLATLRDAARPAGEARAKGPGLIETLRRILTVPSFLVLTAEIVLSGTVMWILVNWLPLFFREKFGLSLAEAGLYGTLWYQVGRVLGVLVGGFPSDRAARVHPRYRMAIMAGAYLLAAPLLTVFVFTSRFEGIAAGIFGFSFLTGIGYVNAQPLLCELLPVSQRSTAIGLMNMSSCLVGGIGVMVAGMLKGSHGLERSFASLSAIQAGVALLLGLAFWKVLPRDLGVKAEERELAL